MIFLRAFQAILLPPLPFVAPKIVDIEGSVRVARSLEFSLGFDQTLAGRVNRKTPEVRHDPAASQSGAGVGAAFSMKFAVSWWISSRSDAKSLWFQVMLVKNFYNMSCDLQR